ncbi:LLM class flavin-dependent oxidoreductase [Jiangella ureilytica]|uniref:LLM class flavin-dependent oxidoreductase n=1 Tax=Jiangella ureilytica TaxID=2530374 RepID=A0A4R4RH57_9ACTN|nr:LLM class flavin-dependent oxidoreductase [Jiangella ureilytica]TDC47882.1 LLM class flavin-dependent oxidoreductase [Jiangella ureilytica]
MRIGIGLPAAVPDADMTTIGAWAEAAERRGFASVGVIDRLVYDNLDPLTALAAAAATTSRVELVTTVLNVNWRGNPTLLAKQLSSVDRLSGGRVVAGLGMGGWPADYAASGVATAGRLATFRRALPGLQAAARTLLGGTVPAAVERAATAPSEGWVAPLFGLDLLRSGAATLAKAWADAGREGRPRVVTGRYVGLGAAANAVADDYIRHYYGAEYFGPARADTWTSPARIRTELTRLRDAGCTDVVLYPCSGDPGQVELIADAVGR